MRTIVLALTLTCSAACARQPAEFSEQNARAHVGMLAGTIGSRPVGSDANLTARSYIIEQLRNFGFDVRVQEADARRPELGRTARVSNIIAVRRGTRDEAVGLMSHYDSVAEAPGAGDDAFGVAVSLEAARVLSARANRNWSLMVLVTDGEEAGLMGAAALVTDREVSQRLKSYLNIEAAGSGGPARLFETGPGNMWIVSPWAQAAPHPDGDSFGVEIYKRLPNDTDFSILKRHDIPGLNFALTDDSYAYHTARDTAERLSARSLHETGQNIVATVTALDAVDITQRSPSPATYFDVAGRAAAAYGPRLDWLIAAAALVVGVIGFVRVSSAAIGLKGFWRWLFTLIWSIVGAVLVVGAMVGATWALRAVREVYHPWYAAPDRTFLLLIAVGTAVGWSVVRVGQFLPERAHGLRHPLMSWSAALPVWILLSSGALWLAPGAAYIWTLPLLVAGLLLSVIPPTNAPAVRIASVLILAASATFWLGDTLDVLRFMVAVFGRLPLVTPVFVFAAILALAGLMLVPPLIATIVRSRPLLRPSLMTAVFLLLVAGSAVWAYMAPAYTYDQPLRRYVRAIQMPASEPAIWEVASTEPGLDLAENAPSAWIPVTGPPPEGVPWGRMPHPFVFRATAASLGPAPMSITGYQTRPLEGGIEIELTVTPRTPGLEATFLLPPGVTPARANLPGIRRRGRWAATYIAVPKEGLTLRASFTGTTADVLRQTEVLVSSDRFPNGTGWQSLPEWLPQQQTVWMATAAWLLRLSDWAGIAPVPSLR